MNKLLSFRIIIVFLLLAAGMGEVWGSVIRIETPTNGTFIVKNGESVVSDGDDIAAGTKLTFELTPEEGYKVKSVQVNDGTTHTYTVNFSYTVKETTDEISVKANFVAMSTYLVSWNVAGTITEVDCVEGATISVPTPDVPADISDKEFVGWVKTPTVAPDVKPTFERIGKASEDVTYYAVFANKVSEDGTEVIVPSVTTMNPTASYGTVEMPDNQGNIWMCRARVLDWSFGQDSEGQTIYKRYIAISNPASNPYIQSPTFEGKVIKVSMRVVNSAKDSKKVYICSQYKSTPPNSADLGTITVAGSEMMTQEYEVDLSESTVNNFYIYASGFVGLDISVTIGNVAQYSDYTTLLGTISIAEACTDGKDCYSTYSSDKAFVVPEEMNVYEVAIEDGKIKRGEYASGAIVPANTGVMVSAQNGGTYNVRFIDAPGESVLGSANCLRPSTNGIAASAMSNADADCMYYRLTMQNRTKIGFWWGAADGAAFDLAANKAYLAVPKSTQAKVSGFSFDDVATGLADTVYNVSVTSSGMYNLSGQRVALPAKGIYIVNGKKYVSK